MHYELAPTYLPRDFDADTAMRALLITGEGRGFLLGRRLLGQWGHRQHSGD